MPSPESENPTALSERDAAMEQGTVWRRLWTDTPSLFKPVEHAFALTLVLLILAVGSYAMTPALGGCGDIV